MSIVPPTSSGAPAAKTQSAVTNPNAALSKDGFLKLFVAQLQHQDPMSPMDASDSVNQMASFSMVEQITNMAGSNTKIERRSAPLPPSACSAARSPTSMPTTTVQTGIVEGVATAKDGTTSLTIADKPGIDPTSITQVA